MPLGARKQAGSERHSDIELHEQKFRVQASGKFDADDAIYFLASS
jgi:hypothetical protein